MSIDGITHEAVYEEMLAVLENLSAREVVETIRQTVARGVVLEANQEFSTKTLRSMTGEESLAVALEHVVSLLEIPLMIESIENAFDVEEVVWMQESTSLSIGTIRPPQVESRDSQSLRSSLMEVVKIAAELGLKLPEVA